MKVRSMAATCLCVVLLLSTAACGGGTSKSAQSALRAVDDLVGAGKTTPLDDLARQRETLRSLPDSAFSAEDLKLRNSLLTRSGSLLVDLHVTLIDNTVRTQLGKLTERANLIRTAVLSRTATWPETFRTDFTNATKEVITEVACGLILDQIAPEQRPSEPGAASTAEKAGTQLLQKLASRWVPTSYQRLVDWQEYAESVATDADQLALNLDGYSEVYIRALSNPGVRKAVVVYLRTCYSPPKPFPAS
jgi:hypothetical protein